MNFINLHISFLIGSNKFLTLIIVMIVLFFLIITVAFFFAFKKDRQLDKVLKETDNFNIRVYTFDYVRNMFYCFDRMNLEKTKSFSEADFLKQFRPSDTYRIQEWLKTLIKDKEASKSIQVEIKISKGNKYLYSLLYCTSLSKSKHLIHFESQLLPFMHIDKAKKTQTKISKKYILSDENECSKFIKKSNADILGSVMYIMLYTKKDTLTKEESKIFETVRHGLLVVLKHYCGKTRKFCKLSPNETILIDISCLSKLMAMNIATTIQTALQQYLNVTCEDYDINVAIGLSIGTLYQGNYSLAKEQSKKMAKAMKDGKTKNDKVLLYDESFFINYEELLIQKEEAKSLIQNSTFTLYYTPTINIISSKQSFFMLNVELYGVSIQDFEDLLSIITKGNIVNGAKNLYTKIIDRINLQSSKYKFNIPIAIEIPFVTIKKFFTVVQTYSRNVSWIVCIRASDILALNDDVKAISKVLNELKSNQIQVGLIIDNLSNGFKRTLLKNFNYFFVPDIFTTKANDIQQANVDLGKINKNYSLFNAPLVYYGLKHYDDIETAALKGGTIFQCDDVALPSSRFESIDEKVLNSVVETANRIRPKDNLNNFLNLQGESLIWQKKK